jgi:hypothetical protein
MRCAWVVAYENSQQMPIYGHELVEIQPPVNRRLEDTSAWINMLTGVDKRVPAGWVPIDEAFPSGNKEPPGHPRCRCTLDYRRQAWEKTLDDLRRQGVIK